MAVIPNLKYFIERTKRWVMMVMVMICQAPTMTTNNGREGSSDDANDAPANKNNHNFTEEPSFPSVWKNLVFFWWQVRVVAENLRWSKNSCVNWPHASEQDFMEMSLKLKNRNFGDASVLLAGPDTVDFDKKFDGNGNDEGASSLLSTLDILRSLEDEGLIERCSDQEKEAYHCFAHDQIELAAHGLLDANRIPQLKLRIG